MGQQLKYGDFNIAEIAGNKWLDEVAATCGIKAPMRRTIQKVSEFEGIVSLWSCNYVIACYVILMGEDNLPILITNKMV